MSATDEKNSRAAKNALVNILFFPGLGTLRSGRWLAGTGQVVLVLAGTAFLMAWLFQELSQYYALMFDEQKPQPAGWMGETGAIFFGAGWLWAAVTSLSLFREASVIRPVPPKLSSVAHMKPVDAKIQKALAALPDWQCDGEFISRTFEFADFPAAMRFVNAIAELAEQAQHHPDIDVRWNKVTLALTTHDAGGLTEKDFALARRCDEQSLR